MRCVIFGHLIIDDIKGRIVNEDERVRGRSSLLDSSQSAISLELTWSTGTNVHFQHKRGLSIRLSDLLVDTGWPACTMSCSSKKESETASKTVYHCSLTSDLS